MFTILSVDDQETNQRLIKKILGQEFVINTAYDGLSAIERTQESPPDLILLDVRMPNLNGLATCSRIREQYPMEELPILFVSGLTSLEDKLRGYEAGGNDYIEKPLEMGTLKQKIDVLLKQRVHLRDVNQSLASTRDAMFSAIRYAGELGSVIHFFENSFQAEEFSHLADAIFSACAQLSLSASVQIRSRDQHHNFSSSGILSPLEEALLSQARLGQRIVSYGTKSIYNADSITILIKNMPLEDSDACGRIRDHLAIILKACEAQVELLEVRKAQQKVMDLQLDELCQYVEVNLSALADRITDCHEQLGSCCDTFLVDFEETAVLCDIDPEHKHLLQKSIHRLTDSQRESLSQQQHINTLINDITHAVQTMKAL